MHTLILLLIACGPKNASIPVAATPSESAEAPERVLDTVSPDYWGEYGLDLTTGNPDVHPGDNFFMHVNGGWYDTFELPADRSRYGSFDLLAEKSEQRVRWVIEDLAAEKASVDTPSGKVAAVYNAYMDDEAIEAAERIGAEKTWFLHMSHEIRHAELDPRLPAGMRLAWDGLKI